MTRKKTVDDRTEPLVKRNRTVPLAAYEGTANHGGICKGCGNMLTWWFCYQLCDRCLTDPPISARPVTGRTRNG